MQKTEIRPLPYTIHKNQLKMNQRLKCKTQNYKNPGRQPRQYHSGIEQTKISQQKCQKAIATKAKIDK